MFYSDGGHVRSVAFDVFVCQELSQPETLGRHLFTTKSKWYSGDRPMRTPDQGVFKARWNHENEVHTEYGVMIAAFWCQISFSKLWVRNQNPLDAHWSGCKWILSPLGCVLEVAKCGTSCITLTVPNIIGNGVSQLNTWRVPVLSEAFILTYTSSKVMQELHAQLTYWVVRFIFLEERLLSLGFQHFLVEMT